VGRMKKRTREEEYFLSYEQELFEMMEDRNIFLKEASDKVRGIVFSLVKESESWFIFSDLFFEGLMNKSTLELLSEEDKRNLVKIAEEEKKSIDL
jgi:hypothetical protein